MEYADNLSRASQSFSKQNHRNKSIDIKQYSALDIEDQLLDKFSIFIEDKSKQ